MSDCALFIEIRGSANHSSNKTLPRGVGQLQATNRLPVLMYYSSVYPGITALGVLLLIVTDFSLPKSS